VVMYSYTYEHYDSCRKRTRQRKKMRVRRSHSIVVQMTKDRKCFFSNLGVYQYEDIRDNIQILINFSNYISFPLIAKLISKRDSLQDIYNTIFHALYKYVRKLVHKHNM